MDDKEEQEENEIKEEIRGNRIDRRTRNIWRRMDDKEVNGIRKEIEEQGK